MTHYAEAKYVKGVHTTDILKMPNVVGLGVSYKMRRGEWSDQLGIAVMVRQKLPLAALPASDRVPKSLDGVQTDVVEVGELRVHNSRKERWRPVPGGVSIAHYQVTAGTLSCMVRDRITGERLVLSNNHVLANSNHSSEGDPVLQPGPADHGNVDEDIVARLERFVPVVFSEEPPTCSIAVRFASIVNKVTELIGSQHRLNAMRVNQTATNQVDAAVARPLEGVEFLDEILDIGVVGGTTPASLGMRVRKSGRTTGYTLGQITILDSTVDVRYGDRTARFEDQIVTSAMSSPGDSGSLLVAEDALLAVGLLFAGSNQATVHNPIQVVLDQLKVSI
ncbi:MAG: hypothetical protein GTO18_20965 [Anaerolineales bacterium]|nr:hypothetical protein [Anaerolineales bacterium]